MGRGYSVKEVIDPVERVTGKKVPVELALGGPATRRRCLPTPRRSATSWVVGPAHGDRRHRGNRVELVQGPSARVWGVKQQKRARPRGEAVLAGRIEPYV